LGLYIRKSTPQRASFFITLGVVGGAGMLVYFKYLNFFIDSFATMLTSIGLSTNVMTFNIIFPIGISFFTFRLISYLVEIHRGKMEPTRDFVAFAAYVAFFPTLLAGPIDRPNDFIPQLRSPRPFNYEQVMDGTRQDRKS